MTYAIYFPEHRHQVPLSVIRRERTLPDGGGTIDAVAMTRVDVNEVIARAAVPSPYTVVDARRFFNLRKPAELDPLLEVEAGDRVEAGQTLAIRGGLRGKRLLSPVSGTVSYIGEGQIILQESAEVLEVEAGMNGVVVEVRPGHGVTIEAYGAVLQGMWGNNRRAIGTLRLEPETGIENVYRDALDIEFRGVIVVTKRPLRQTTLQVMEDQGFSGVIAPSMEPDLIDAALTAPCAILLTEGFGRQRMNGAAFAFLEEMRGRQATLDAVLPAPLEPRRPELIVNVPLAAGSRPPAPNPNQPLRQGDHVRVASGDSAGSTGRVIGLPKSPVLLDNGLRVLAVQVELVTGERLTVPLANIDVLGS